MMTVFEAQSFYSSVNYEMSQQQQQQQQQQQNNCVACEFPIGVNGTPIGRQKLCQACRKFFYRHSMKTHERLEMAPCMCKFKLSPAGTSPPYVVETPAAAINDGTASQPSPPSSSSSIQQQQQSAAAAAASSARSHSICKSCRYRRCLQAGLADDSSNTTTTITNNNNNNNNKQFVFPNNDPTFHNNDNNNCIKLEQDNNSGEDSDEILSAANRNRSCSTANCSSLSGYQTSNEDSPTANLDVSQLPCSVCGWSATGVHFGAVTCDACKAFYGRFARRLSGSANNGNVIAGGRASVSSLIGTNSCCLTGGKCFDNGTSLHISRVSQNRMRCASCRIQKCIAIGMSPFGSVAGRRSQAQKKAITEAVKEFFKSSNNNSSPSAANVIPSQSSQQLLISDAERHHIMMISQSAAHLSSSPSSSLSPSSQQFQQQQLYYNPATIGSLNARTSGSSTNNSSNGSEPEQKSVVVSAAGSIYSKYSELVDAIRNKRGISPSSGSNNTANINGTTVSELIWLYDSGSEVIDLKQMETKGFTRLPVEMDPQRLFERFITTPLSPLPYSRQLVLDRASRAEWLIGKVVTATKSLAKIREVRVHVTETMGPLEIWRVVMDNFLMCFKCALQFVRTLPGFDWLQEVSDRILLFSNALFPLLVLQVSLDYDPVSGVPLVFNIDKDSMSLAKQKMILVAKAEPVQRESGISLKNAHINIAEFGLIGGLLFFNDQIGQLVESEKVRLIAEDYMLAIEMLGYQQSSPDDGYYGKRRFEIIMDQVRMFSGITQGMLRLLEACKFIYPAAVGIEPLLEEVTQKVAGIQIGGSSPNGSPPLATMGREFPPEIMSSPINNYHPGDFIH